MIKNKPIIITLIIILSIIAIFLVVGLVFMLTGKFNFKTRIMNFGFGNKISENLVYEKEYPFTHDLENIDISLNMGDIEIRESNNNLIRVEIYSEESYYNVNDVNDLSIEVKNKTCHFFCFNVKKDKVIVYLPTNYEHNISLKNNYGDIKVEKFADVTLDIVEDCGDVIVEEINSAKIKNSYGDIEVKKAINLDIEEDCGDVDVDMVSSAIIENSFGDIRIDTVSNGYVKIENNCGDIEIKNLELVKDSNIIDDLGNIEIGNTNKIYIDAKTDLGDVDIRNNEREAEVKLTIENNCGDIEVNN